MGPAWATSTRKMWFVQARGTTGAHDLGAPTPNVSIPWNARKTRGPAIGDSLAMPEGVCRELIRRDTLPADEPNRPTWHGFSTRAFHIKNDARVENPRHEERGPCRMRVDLSYRARLRSRCPHRYRP